MPTTKRFGDRVVILDPGKTWTPAAPLSASPPIHIDRFFRNGLAPDALAMSSINEAVTQAVLYRTKEIWGEISILGDGWGVGFASSSTERARYRFAFHTSPYSHSQLCRVCLSPQTSGFDRNAYVRLDIFSSVDETSPVVSQEFYYGVNALNSHNTQGWPYLKFTDKFITGLSPDTDYYGKFTDCNYGQLQSASIVDLQTMPGGSLPQNFTSESQILDVYRSNVASLIPPMWKRGGAKVLNWSVSRGNQPETIVSATPSNIFDQTVTTISSSTPGYTLDMRGKARLSQSGVPCVMKAFGAVTDVGTSGSVFLKDSAGNTVASIVNGWATSVPFSSVPQWESVAFELPATVDKYDLQFCSDGSNTFELYAISIYEYEA